MNGSGRLGYFRRRAFLGAGVAALQHNGAGALQRLELAQADKFVDGVGVCTHLASAPYDVKFNELLPQLRRLGLRHLRDELRPSDDLEKWRKLRRDAGLQAHLLVSPSTNNIKEMMHYVSALGVGGVSAIEGQNEGDSSWFQSQPSAGSNWRETVVAYQKEVFEAVRARYPRDTLPVVSPTVLDYRPEDMVALRPAAAFCDLVALHAYPQGQREPETASAYAALEWYLTEMRDRFKPGSPAMVTETGYSQGQMSISARAAGIYIPRLLLNSFARGIVRTFIYELYDEGRDPADAEQGYGLLTVDGVAKPAFDAIALLLTELADPGPAFLPSPFEIEVRREPIDLRLCAFAKRDGRQYLALWRAARSWDPADRRNVTVGPANLDIYFPIRPSCADALKLWPGSRWRAAKLKGNQLTVAVSDIVTLIRLAP